MSLGAKGIAREILESGSGKLGTVFFIVLVVVSLFVVATFPLDFGTRYWNNPSYWADNPKASPPAWINFFTEHRKPEHRVLDLKNPTSIIKQDEKIVKVYEFKIRYQEDEMPTFLSFTIYNLTYYTKIPPIINVELKRPDGDKVLLYTIAISHYDEKLPAKKYYESPLRVQLSGEKDVASSVSEFLKERFGVEVSQSELVVKGVEKFLFGTPNKKGDFVVLKGDYSILVKFSVNDENDNVERVRFVVGGSVFGLMGTDGIGRDLAVGLLFGFPVALFIGLITSTLVTLIGATLGIISGYIGGKTDTGIQRSADILANIPLLPLLIFLAFVLGQKLWILIMILVAFGWPGLTIVVRSMVLQIKSGQFVEAALSIGASRWRIMFKHIFPQTAPFVFAQMIFTTPGAILAEASLSFLGLGDPSIPTWGQILEAGFRSGGVYVGYWWWVLPPGLLIVVTAITFVLLALAIEPIVNPRLKTVT